MFKQPLCLVVGVSFLLTNWVAAEEKKEEPAAPEKAEESSSSAALKDPSKATEKAPEKFKVNFVTTAGDFTVEVTRKWAPMGADRFYNLVEIGYFKDIAFFRVMDGFMAQFGIHGDPAVAAVWRNAKIKDDPKGVASNVPGTITFATSGPNSRTTQLFINFGNNARLDSDGFTPFGRVTKGMDNVNKIYKGHSQRPNQGLIQSQGNAYLKKEFPELTYIKSVTLAK
ncbi:MAG: peptidyl-prolyl cis-trans isomerase A (cyclophilin A) [Verrucomicrobiales bacterium]|jgi:peptidyl-prolyl cis-trans isomerase A (cyclophilin A)